MNEQNPTDNVTNELPPLDAGANENTSPYEEIPDRPAKETPQPEKDVEANAAEEDSDVYNAIKDQIENDEKEDKSDSADSEEKTPEDTEPEKEQKKDDQKQVEKSDIEITDDELDRALDSVDNFRNLVGKIEERTQQNFTKHLIRFAGEMSEVFEKMIYLHDATREFPEILAYQNAFRVAYNKACKGAKAGDLRGPVYKAVETLRNEMGKFDALKSGKKIDLRSKSAPKHPSGSGRQQSAPKKDNVDDGITFLETLL